MGNYLREVPMIYFSSKNIPVLQPFAPTERIAIIQGAAKNMPFARRAVANALKLLILIGLFWSLVYVPGLWWKVFSLLAAGLLYPLLLMPVTINLAMPYFSEEIARRDANETFAQQQPTPKDATGISDAGSD